MKRGRLRMLPMRAELTPKSLIPFGQSGSYGRGDCRVESQRSYGDAHDRGRRARYPLALREDNRAIWQIEAVKVYDGRGDGMASTTDDNTLFMTQGIFAP